MKRTKTLSSSGDYARVKITIELVSESYTGRNDTDRAMHALINGVTDAICKSPLTGAAYPHQVKVR